MLLDVVWYDSSITKAIRSVTYLQVVQADMKRLVPRPFVKYFSPISLYFPGHLAYYETLTLDVFPIFQFSIVIALELPDYGRSRLSMSNVVNGHTVEK